MYLRDRMANLSLLAGAAAAWLALVVLFLTRSPVGDGATLLTGALMLGGAVALTIVPLAWLAGFARKRRIAYRGDWWIAARRGALVGLVIALLVVLRGQGALTLAIAVFVIAMAIFVELALTLRR